MLRTRLLSTLTVLSALALCPAWQVAQGQDSVFDEPLVTGEPGAGSSTPPGGLDGSTGTDPRQEAFMQKMGEAEQLMQQKNWSGAVAIYNEILQIGRHPLALLNQGICFRELGLTDLAISSISMSIITPGANQTPGLVEQAYVMRGELYVDTGRYREAVDDFTQAAQLNPSNPQPYYLQGKSLLRMVVASPGGGMDQSGQASLLQAVKSLERAISLRSDFGDAYLERGRVLFRLRQLEYGIEDYEQAVRYLGPTSEAAADLGVAYSYQATQETYEPKPDDARIKQLLHDALSMLDNYLKSAQLGQRTAPWETRDPLRTSPEKVMLARSDTRIALANELEGDEQESLYRAALTDADQLLANDIEDDDEARAYFTRGTALRMLGDLDAAVEAFTQAISVYESAGASYSDAYLKRGICFYYQDKFDLAEQDFRAASYMPSNPYVYDHRAMLWSGLVDARQGNYEDAIRSYTRSIAASPRYTPAYLNRGLAYMNVGRYEQALEDFDVILRQDPDNDQVKTYRDLAYQKQ